MPDAEALIPQVADKDIDWVQEFLQLNPFDEQRVDSGQELSKDYDLAGWLVARLVVVVAAIPSCLI